MQNQIIGEILLCIISIGIAAFTIYEVFQKQKMVQIYSVTFTMPIPQQWA